MRIRPFLLFSVLICSLLLGQDAMAQKKPKSNPKEQKTPSKGGKGGKKEELDKNSTVKIGNPSKNVKAGDKAYSEGDYYNASIYYRLAQLADSLKLDVAYKYAEACRMNHDYAPAERWYKFVVDKDKGQEQEFPMAPYWLGIVKKHTGKYREAKKFFKQYASKNRKAGATDPNFTYVQKAKMEATLGCDYAAALQSKPDTTTYVLHMDETVNTEYNELSPFQLRDSILYFASKNRTLRMPASERSRDTVKTTASRIYKTFREDSAWMFTNELSRFYNDASYNNQNGSFSPDNQRFYFTRSRIVPASQMPVEEIWVSRRLDKKWQAPQKLPAPVNIPGFSNTQPALADNGEEGDFLYFSSNRTGGKGGMDIWRVQLNNQGAIVSSPENLGDSINSPMDEITPSWDPTSKLLYFSSDWHKGLGGFDIFEAKVKADGSWKTPENLRYPSNSVYDDTYYTVNYDGGDAYLVSNRVGSISKKGPACCTDIYYVIDLKRKRHADSLKAIVKKAIYESQNLEKVFPITLYFAHNSPEAEKGKGNDTLSPIDYETAVREYLEKRDTILKIFAKGLSGAARKEALGKMETFFKQDVEGGFDKLEEVCYLLKQGLTAGREIKIKIKGYTSPIATPEYNVVVAKRRIHSLVRYLEEYSFGVLKPYLITGKLQVIREPIGEAQVSKTVSDNPNDIRSSVYSIQASRERKIQIIGVSVSPVPKK